VLPRRRFPGISDNLKARECLRIIVGWMPMPVQAATVRLLHSLKC
jgi:hypothetical protein